MWLPGRVLAVVVVTVAFGVGYLLPDLFLFLQPARPSEVATSPIESPTPPAEPTAVSVVPTPSAHPTQPPIDPTAVATPAVSVEPAPPTVTPLPPTVASQPTPSPSPSPTPVPTAPETPQPTATTDPTPVPPPVTSRTYTVQPGDTLWLIAQRHGVSGEAILIANNLSNADALQVGQVLEIPSAADVDQAPVPRTYTVQPGDTLWQIAERHGVSGEAILVANNLSNADALQVGQVLQIPVAE